MDETYEFIEKAKDKLNSSKALYEIGQYGDSVSISYYVMFLIAKGLLILKGFKPKKHSGLIHIFGKEYVKNNSFNQELFKKFIETQTLREQADYDATDEINKKIANSIKLAEKFIEESNKFLK